MGDGVCCIKVWIGVFSSLLFSSVHYIGSMSERESVALVRSLMGDAFDQNTALSYARSAQGSPFYVAQLVHGAPADAATPSPAGG